MPDRFGFGAISTVEVGRGQAPFKDWTEHLGRTECKALQQVGGLLDRRGAWSLIMAGFSN
jgi:hypothetical protein